MTALEPRLSPEQNTPSHDATQRQRLASDPDHSAWVRASAGSGKTKVLTDRMLRLLLPREGGRAGTKPHKILALTYTKAAANEMSLRLSARLSKWAIMPDEELAKDIEANLLGRTPTSAEIESARKLFAAVMDTPGGLKILTLHSFCQSILGRFPVEAGLSPHFTPLEEGDADEFLEQARRDVLLQSAQDPSTPLARAVHTLALALNEDQLISLTRALKGERYQMQTVLDAHFGIDGLYTYICTRLDIQPGDTAERAVQSFLHDRRAEKNIRRVIAPMAAAKGKTDPKNALILQLYWDADVSVRAAHYAAYRQVFLTAEGAPRKKLASNDVFKADGDAEQILLDEMSRISAHEDYLQRLACADLTHASLQYGQAILHAYDDKKQKRGALDFDDLILKTLNLLKTNISWVHYKLDEGLDHILLDEAQDTNPEQWDIIRYLTAEFFDGLGQSESAERSLFVVGDEKQSIYSFQRAAPDKFGDMLDYYRERIRSSGQIFNDVPMNTSFRSVQIVLDSVDHVFGRLGQTGQPLSREYLSHIAFREGQGGRVEIWPLCRSDEEEDSGAEVSSGWAPPVTVVESRSGARKMAEKIAETIRTWMADGEKLESYGRPIDAGDILILIRSRTAFVGQLVRALKTRNIPVSGIDRMVLSDQLVVQDLCAVAGFALQPDDNLLLAGLLKSPFLGWDEEKLYKIAQPREGSLWEAVKKSGDSATIDWLTACIELSGAMRPYEFFSRLTQEPCPADDISGLHAIKRRLGQDALDPLDEFLNLSLSYEATHTASLQGFLRWQEEGRSEIKREQEKSGGAVRIMTVHGAKGLQAPIVFLPDTVRTRSGSKSDRLLWPHKTGLDIPLACLSKENAPELVQKAFTVTEQKDDEEYSRLLYVAMTRAEERLYIGGYTGKKPPSGNMRYWYDDIYQALKQHPDIQAIPTESGADGDALLRLDAPRSRMPDKTGDAALPQTEATQSHTAADSPAHLKRPPAKEPDPPQPLVPSRPSQDEDVPVASPLSVADPYRFKRGTVSHRLLQTLPDLPPQTRRDVARAYVARPAYGLPAAQQDSIVNEIMVILEDTSFAPLFGAGSIAEVPVTGYLGGKTLISGQIDRLLVTHDEILIVDYKTNRPPPQKVEDVHPAYRKQLKAYADALRRIYPDKKVRAALLWTDGPHLMEITFEPEPRAT